MLNPAKLRHRVVIQRPSETQSTVDGSMGVSWVTLATVWASIEPLSARDLIAAQAEGSQISARVIIRYRNDITPACRLLHAYSGKYYNIEGILADKDSGLEYLTLPCSEGLRYT